MIFLLFLKKVLDKAEKIRYHKFMIWNGFKSDNLKESNEIKDLKYKEAFRWRVNMDGILNHENILKK